ncbi:carboxylesterase/lipase family protein [Streptomyces sp. NPDC020403]|uniref:carboxylesterase/lipase family protein n=1 Tax=unclassified Streptomyces TaxID=2593676 RepID=UPI0033C06387
MTGPTEHADTGAQGWRLRRLTRRRSGGWTLLRAGATVVVSVLVALTSVPVAPASSSASSSAPEVSVAQGRLRGMERSGVSQFLGIRYAAPPVGRLRWRPPQPAEAWSGTRAATQSGPKCPQTLDKGTTTKEDCLFLNVYAPADRPAGPRPVMVWIHGGSFMYGSGGDYDPSVLAAKGVVVVTINYRLGALGFLALPSLATEAADHTSGAYGLMDQQAALRWVQANISAFGGDRHKVTIFGESAGGSSVCMHIASPTARGLFQRAIAESGCLLASPTQAQADQAGTSFATKLHCTDAATAARCLRTKPVQKIVREQEGRSWLPAYQGTIYPRRVRDALVADAYNHVPVLMGTNHDEGNYFIALDYPQGLRPRDYPGAITAHFGPEAAARIKAQYPLSAYRSPLWALGTALGDAVFSCPSYSSYGMFAAAGTVYPYEFDDPRPAGFPPPGNETDLGATHGTELAYVFQHVIGEPGKRPGFTPAQQALSDTMVGYWTHFAMTGNPNAPHTPRWRPFTARAPYVQELTPAGIGTNKDFPARHRCAFWEPLVETGTVVPRL